MVEEEVGVERVDGDVLPGLGGETQLGDVQDVAGSVHRCRDDL